MDIYRAQEKEVKHRKTFWGIICISAAAFSACSGPASDVTEPALYEATDPRDTSQGQGEGTSEVQTQTADAATDAATDASSGETTQEEIVIPITFPEEREPRVTGIEAVLTGDDYKIYDELMAFDIEVYAKYSDGSREKIDGWGINPPLLEYRTNDVIVFWGEYSTVLSVEATPRYPYTGPEEVALKENIATEIGGMLPVTDCDYGSHAVEYLREICTDYPNRVFADGRSAACGDYLIEKLASFGYEVQTHEFSFGAEGRNIIVEKKGKTDKLIMLCAHYDSVDTQGCDDNGSGVAVLLEVALRLAQMQQEPECTVRMIFFDAEEEGSWGSMHYCADRDEDFFDRMLCVINIDSVAGGDNMYVHGGWSDGSLTWLREEAIAVSGALGLDMTTHPGTRDIPAATRVSGSDMRRFNVMGIPYIYLEASVYSDNSADGNPVHYQTEDPAVENGQILHTVYDDYDTLERIFPGRIALHLRNYTILMIDLAMNIDENGVYSDGFYLPETVVAK